MYAYYATLGWRQLRRSPVLTLLVIITLAAGVAASMSTLTVLMMMSADPIPHKSDRLFAITLDNMPVEGVSADTDVPDHLSWTDVRNLREAGLGVRSTGMYGIGTIVTPRQANAKPFFGNGIAVDSSFFAMMDTPFLHGGAWSPSDDRGEARVVVIGRELAEKLFEQGQNPVGQAVRINNVDWRIAGVLDRWRPLPVFYSMDSSISEGHDIFVPLATALALETDVNGNTSCFEDSDPGFAGLMASECVWMRLWVETDAASSRDTLRQQLNGYIAEQKARGRLPRPDRSALYDVREWLAHLEVVDNDTRVQTWLAFGFLAVCLINSVGLLLAKFGARAGDVAVRRALGASRGQIVAQYLCESAVLGLVGSLVGLGLTWGLLKVLAAQSSDLEALAQLDLPMLSLTVALSVGAAVIAGLLPTWQAARVTPALQLKSQ